MPQATSPRIAISIHALREEGDTSISKCGLRQEHFYPRPPRGGRPLSAAMTVTAGLISIHALREEGDPRQRHQTRAVHISIHALREEGDSWALASLRDRLKFLSTPSARRATRDKVGHNKGLSISIHALREEGDRLQSRLCTGCQFHFYPRPPRGGRPRPSTPTSPKQNFYPRPPRGGRPGHRRPALRGGAISIHALREEGDGVSRNERGDCAEISIHALREEGDSKNREKTLCFCLIIHLPA